MTIKGFYESVTSGWWEEQLRTVVNIYSKYLHHWIFPINRQQMVMTFVGCMVVTVKSQKSAKGEYIHKLLTYECTFMTFWFHEMFLAHSWLTVVTTFFEQTSTLERESLVRGDGNVTRMIYFADFCDFTVTTTRRK